LGQRVRIPDPVPPGQRWRAGRCPTCGQRTAEINGAYLRWRRERAGLDQRTMAKSLDVSGPYLSDIERNRRPCPGYIITAYTKLRKAQR
jgi:DNA-binding XRE family transcriptional regulator